MGLKRGGDPRRVLRLLGRRNSKSSIRRKFSSTSVGNDIADEISRLHPTFGQVNWYPGHMAKAARDIENARGGVDFVVEVRDARIPYASANDHIKDLLGNKPKLVLLNKADLACPRELDSTVHYLTHVKGENVMQTSSSTTRSASKIVTALEKLVPQRFRTLDALVLIVGVPNVGKSTLINGIRNYCMRRENRTSKMRSSKQHRRGKWGRGVKTGRNPGVTRTVSHIRVSSDPPIAMMDTPGMLLPRIESLEVGLKLAITGAVRDAVVGEDVLVNYLIQRIRESNGATRKLGEALGIEKSVLVDNDARRGSPIEAEDVLRAMASARGKDPDDEGACGAFRSEILKSYRNGDFGRWSLEGKRDRDAAPRGGDGGAGGSSNGP